MGAIYLVRHGQASFGARDYDQLSAIGTVQSQMLGHWLRQTDAKADRLFCGTLRRHHQTAQACLAAWQDQPTLAIDQNPAFDEFNHQEILIRAHPQFAEAGYLEGFLRQKSDHPAGAPNDSRRAFQKVFSNSVSRWVSGRHDHEYLESWPAFRNRCVAGLRQIRDLQTDNDVWIFTSGGPIAAMVGHVLGADDARILDLNWSILNSSITALVPARKRFLLHQFNSIAHLALARRSDLVTYR